MKSDYKIIKKYYGENMAKLCRQEFPTILEEKGTLSSIMIKYFYPSRTIYQSIIREDKINSFRSFIESKINKDETTTINSDKTPTELLAEAGYDLYECHTEEELDSFRKYYKEGEELCSFRGNRLKTHHVFFAVKKDVDTIKREDFLSPKRQDKYGTSVISIQFSKGHGNSLSIKNRYNHTVDNPDATFSNNLDYIIKGLTNSFCKYYNLSPTNSNKGFELLGMTCDKNGKYYPYNYEINNIYYCPDNIIIENAIAKKLDRSRYILMDYYILDLSQKKIFLYDETIEDSFLDGVGPIDKVMIEKQKNVKVLEIIQKEGTPIYLCLDKNNNIASYLNENIEELQDDFMRYNLTLHSIEVPNVKKVGNNVLYYNTELKSIELPETRRVGKNFLYYNNKLQSIELDSVSMIDSGFIRYNRNIETLSFPNVRVINDEFLQYNEPLLSIYFPKLERVGNSFLESNQGLEEVNLPSLVETGNAFMMFNREIREVNVPRLEEFKIGFLQFSPIVSKVTTQVPHLWESVLDISSTDNLEKVNTYRYPSNSGRL